MDKIHIYEFATQHLSDLRIEKDREAHIRLFAERTEKQVGQIITNIVTEIMALVLVGRSLAATQLSLPAHPPEPALLPVRRLLTAGEVADFLNISKAKAYRMMQKREMPSPNGKDSSGKGARFGNFFQGECSVNNTRTYPSVWISPSIWIWPSGGRSWFPGLVITSRHILHRHFSSHSGLCIAGFDAALI